MHLEGCFVCTPEDLQSISSYTAILGCCWILLYHVQTTVATNHIGDVMISVLTTSAVDRGLESRSDQTRDYKSVRLLH
jgi:hypothetical protein